MGWHCGSERSGDDKGGNYNYGFDGRDKSGSVMGGSDRSNCDKDGSDRSVTDRGGSSHYRH